MTKLSIQHISIQTGGKDVVHDVSMDLEGGKVYVLMGSNGSGKSTLLNGMFSHPDYEMTEGSLVLDGEDITDLATEKKAQKGLFLSMQYLPEIAGVTLASFMHKAYRSLHDPKISMIDFFGLLEEKAKELQIDSSFLTRDVNRGLSGGEKKLSEVLQLAVLRPKFAFLDEIDSGVDVDAQQKVFHAISVLRSQGTGFLLITHYNAILEHIDPDHVYVMGGGRIVTSGQKELASQIAKEGFAQFVQ
jgi:Fe-S cluster assembly ATP-binding protein